jgi:hypothetical protein
MRFDEIVVLQHLLNQGAHLLASLDTGILLEDPVAFRGELLEAVRHPINSVMVPAGGEQPPATDT